MAPLAAQPERTPLTRPSRRHGLWAGLSRRAGANRQPARLCPGGLWESLDLAARPPDQTAPAPPRPPGGLWAALDERADPARYRPQTVAGVVAEEVVEAGQSYTVLRSPTGSYLRLTAAERELWQAMDGSQTVAQLATLGFLRFRQLLPVAELVQNLKQHGFLTETPANVYRRLRANEERRSAEGWGRRVLTFLQSHTFAVEGVDGAISALYRAGGWVCFTRPFAVLHLLVSLLGLIAFGLAMGRATTDSAYQLLDADGITGSLLALWAAVLVSFVLHELAHALAVKHYGRRVLRGGVMLYYGMPAAFVDTSDIWLAGRVPRIVVSLAGPLSDLLVGGLAALFAFALPDAPLSGAAYKLAFACYVATLLNFNPLLELDGYFVLVDWLRLPNLRARALAFVSGPLWGKLRARAPLNRDERIFALYGLLTALYTVGAIVLAALFWQRQLLDVIAGLWAGGWGGQILAALIVGAVVVPIGLGLLLAAWGLLRAGATWIERRGYGRRPALVAATLLALVGLLALLPLRFALPDGRLPWPIVALAPALLAVAFAALTAIRPDYRGASIARAIDWLLVVHVLSLVTITGRTFAPDLGPAWTALDGISLLLLLLTGFVALLDVDLHQAPPRELGLTAFLLLAAFGLGGAAIHRAGVAFPADPFALHLLAAAPVYCGVLALALLLPHLMGLRDSRLFWCWLAVWLGAGGQTAAYILELLPEARNTPPDLALNILAAGLWATAWSVHYVILRSLSPEELAWPIQPATSEAQRLQRAFQHTYAGCYLLLRNIYGARRAQALDDRMDVLAATANWDVTLDRERARIGAALAEQPLDVQGARYAEALRYTVATIEAIGGASFARRVVQAAYDALPWPEREAADRRCFPNTPWAQELSRAFGDARAARLRLLRQVDLFVACDDDELAQLAAALRPVRVPAGQTILEAGAPAAGLWIVEAGEVAILEGRTLTNELHRGEVFGVEVHEPGRANGADAPPDPRLAVLGASAARYKATVASTLLFLPAADLRRLAGEMAAHTAEGLEYVTALRLLERVPLFADMPRHTLRGLARVVEPVEYRPRSIVVRQAQPSGMFYLIKSGRAAVIVRSGEAGPGGAARVVATLGPEEFFGELELLRSTPPVASVVAITPLTLLALPHTAIAELLVGSASIARGLEQVGSGRLHDLRNQIGGPVA